MSQYFLSGRSRDGQQRNSHVSIEDDAAPAYFDLSSMNLNGAGSQRNSYASPYFDKNTSYESIAANDLGERAGRRISQVARKPLPATSRIDSQESFTAALLDEQQRKTDAIVGRGEEYDGARVSQWKIGWKTPTLMVTLYLMGLVSSLSPLVLC
jgi:hypothetical protein